MVLQRVEAVYRSASSDGHLRKIEIQSSPGTPQMQVMGSIYGDPSRPAGHKLYVQLTLDPRRT